MIGRPSATELLLKTFGYTDQRPCTLQFPANYSADPITPRPLFMILAPVGGTSPQTRYNCTALVDDRPGGAFVLNCPQNSVGLPGPQKAWYASTSCCGNDGVHPEGSPIDAAYIEDVIAELRTHLPIDPTRIVLGPAESNGEFLARKIACEHPEMVSTLIGLCGADRTAADLAANPCVGSPLVSSLHLHGTGDNTVAWNGPAFVPGIVPAMSDPAISANPALTPNTTAQVAARNGCGALQAPYDTIHFLSSEPGPNTTRQAYATCPLHGETELWVNDLGHCTNQTYAADSCSNYFVTWVLNHPSTPRPRRAPANDNRPHGPRARAAHRRAS